MPSPSVNSPDRDVTHHAGPMVWTCAAFVAGLIAGRLLDAPSLWLSTSSVTSLIVLFFLLKRRHRAALYWSMIAVAALGAARTNLSHRLPTDHVSALLQSGEPVLTQAIGRVVGPPRPGPEPRGALSHLNHDGPTTLITLALESLQTQSGAQPVTGTLLVKLTPEQHRLRSGQRVRITGWMSDFFEASNPGEADYRAIMHERGYDGRMSVHRRDNCVILSEPALGVDAQTIRLTMADAAAASLRLGLRDTGANNQTRIAFLDTILLGRWSNELGQLSEAYRRVGLVHVLCISGAHLVIVAALVWAFMRCLPVDPRMVSVVTLFSVAIYAAAVPWAVPVARAAVVALILGCAAIARRRARGIDAMALAAIVVLAWRPDDLLDPGFQLSFGASAAMLLLSNRLGERILPRPPVQPMHATRWYTLKRWTADYTAANVVAFVVTLPLVTLHFGAFSPVALGLGLIALPAVSLLIWWGLTKVTIGLFLPSAGIAMARPLEWMADVQIAVIESVAGWSWSSISVPGGVSALWAVAALAVGLAWLCGWFVGRRVALLCCVALVTTWALLGPSLAWTNQHDTTNPTDALKAQLAAKPAVTCQLFSLSVGDGSCFLLRLRDKDDAGGIPGGGGWKNVMFDCGSMQVPDIGLRSVVPALQSLGVNHLDALLLSHADMDHVGGALDVADHVKIERAFVTPQCAAHAITQPHAPVSQVMQGLSDRGVKVEAITRGWRQSVGLAEMELLWPIEGFSAPRDNDTSMVLSTRISGRRILLNGDIQELAMRGLFAAQTDLRADVTDLPHHGSFVDSSVRWLDSVTPSIVLQSTGAGRLRLDKWADTMAARPSIQRLITARSGALCVLVREDGSMQTWRFRGDGRVENAESPEVQPATDSQ